METGADYRDVIDPSLARDVLARAIERAVAVLPYDIRLASELEFYIRGEAPVEEISGEIIQHLFQYLRAQSVPFTKVERERGKAQFENALQHTAPLEAADWSEATRRMVGACLEEICLHADFHPKPFPQDFGSGLHAHISLHDRATGENVFHKRSGEYAPVLLHALGGLLATMKDALLLCAPHPADYARFEAGFDAPTCICWGGNNRTVALRLPDTGPDSKHIEHRVAGADADSYLVMAAVVAGVAHGISGAIEPAGQIFGNAYLSVYNLEPIPTDYAVAVRAFTESGWVADWFGADFVKQYLAALGIA